MISTDHDYEHQALNFNPARKGTHINVDEGGLKAFKKGKNSWEGVESKESIKFAHGGNNKVMAVWKIRH